MGTENAEPALNFFQLLADRWRHPRGRERAPRCMGSIVFEKNERHAAWERSWPTAGATPAAQNERHAAWESFVFKKTIATLHGSAPGRPEAPPDHPKTTPRPLIEKVSIFHQNVDLALTLAMGTFTENPCARMIIL